MEKKLYENLDSTLRATESYYQTVEQKDFSTDPRLIYDKLEKKLSYMPFCYYLQRYIYEKAEIPIEFSEVPLSDYCELLKAEFHENHTPCSFEPTTAKLSALAKNWLTQRSVNRKVVFLLGFGLRMSVDDVNEMLMKGLHEQGINAKNPFEVICWYCYTNKYSYLKFEELLQLYEEIPPSSGNYLFLTENMTVNIRETMYAIDSEVKLFRYLSKLRVSEDKVFSSVTSKLCFDELLVKAQETVADIYNNYKDNEKEYFADDITISDLENMLAAAHAIGTEAGKFYPMKYSQLQEQFDKKRFNRQHMNDIKNGKAEVTRFDLITLNFLVYSQKYIEDDKKCNKRAYEFEESINVILRKCYMGELYIQDPYEHFLLLCLQTQDPLVTYSDVWALSFQKEF